MDVSQQESLVESLREIGLNRYEANVYLGLVSDQTARVAEISRRTGVPQVCQNLFSDGSLPPIGGRFGAADLAYSLWGGSSIYVKRLESNQLTPQTPPIRGWYEGQ